MACLTPCGLPVTRAQWKSQTQVPVLPATRDAEAVRHCERDPHHARAPLALAELHEQQLPAGCSDLAGRGLDVGVDTVFERSAQMVSLDWN